MSERRHIGSFTGLKFLMTCLVPVVHANLPVVTLAVQTRFVWVIQFFFFVSGFCLSARYWEEWSSGGLTLKAFWDSFFRKLKALWPLHLVGLAVFLAWMAEGQAIDRAVAVRAVVNALGLSPWCADRAFDFNSASWFVADLLFCYLAAPLLITLFARSRRAWPWLLAVFGLRYGMEWVLRAYPGQFLSVNMHTFPVVRLLEFAFGLLLFPVFDVLRRRVSVGRTFGTVLELAALAVVASVVMYNPFGLSKAVQGLFVGGTVVVFAFDAGWISRALGAKTFARLAPYELMIFMLHLPVQAVVQPLIQGFSPFVWFAFWMVATLVVSWAWLQLADARASLFRRRSALAVFGLAVGYFIYRLGLAYLFVLPMLKRWVLSWVA